MLLGSYEETEKFHGSFPSSLTQKVWGEFFPKKSFPWGDFLDKFMGWGKFKSYSTVFRWGCGELACLGDKPAEEVCLERLRVGVNCLWYLAVVVIFMGLGGAKSLVGLGKKQKAFLGGSISLFLNARYLERTYF